jgi:hypothetical protein
MRPAWIASLVTAFVVLGAAVAAGPVDVAGVWSLRLGIDAASAPTAQMTFKQDGTKLTGTCLVAETDGESFTLTGQVSESKVTWRCASKGRPVAASFEGTVSGTGKEIAGTWITGTVKGTFKGSRRAD